MEKNRTVQTAENIEERPDAYFKEVDNDTAIILDNATFRRKSVLSGLAKMYGCEVLFLPPYPP